MPPVRILIVEDEPVDAELVTRTLRTAGLAIETSCVEEEADFVLALDSFEPDLIVSDYRLPRFDGMAVLRLAQARRPGTPVIIVTGSINEETAVECLKAGAADYVIKEHLGRLGTAVRSTLDRLHFAAENRRVEAERLCAQEALAGQYALLRAVIDNSDALVFAVDCDLRYLAFNRAHAEQVSREYGVEIAVGMPIARAVDDPEGGEAITGHLRRALGGLGFSLEIGGGPHARTHRLSLSLNPIRTAEGKVTGVVAVAQDVTHLRRQEERLRQLYRAVEQSPVSIVITDASGCIQYVNPRFEEVSGFSAAEAIGRNPRLVKSGRMPAATYEELWGAISSGGEWSGELLNRRKDGGLFWEWASISAVRNAAGRIQNYVAVKEDITERRRAAEVLKQTEQQLVLAQKMEAIGRLAGGVAHDFNNLLSVISGHGERLLDELGPEHPNRGRVEQVLWSAGKAAQLTRQLLAFSRRQVLEPRVVRLDAVVSDARQMLERVIGEDIDLAVAVSEKLGSVRADPGQMVQVLLNLAVNARDAMPQGGRLTIEFADVDLDARYASSHPPFVPGPYVMLAVTDTGLGMDAETQRRIFEPFFTTKPEGQGTGLGLSTVYGIVKQSGGFVWVYSEPRIGTSFKVYLPRVGEPALPEAPGEAPDAPARTAAHPARGRVLLAEDDAGVRGLMKDILEGQGHLVLSAEHPMQALELASGSEPVDVLVTDVIMPGMSGRELARRLQARQPGVRVLFVSGYAGEALARHGGIARGERFLQKPFSERALLDSVAAAIEDAPVRLETH
jgi:PAS domain S-box-containing protein